MKQALRKTVMARLAGMSHAQMDCQAGAVAHAVRHNEAYIRASTIAAFANLPENELPTERMLSNAYRDGKRVFLPHLQALPASERTWPSQKQHICMRELNSMVDINALQPVGPWGIREPLSGLDALDTEHGGPGLDLLIMPGVAFTRDCRRLGHGGGFYDAFIAEHMRITGRRPFLLAVGFAEQLVDDIPTELHDEPVDFVALGDGSTYVRPGLVLNANTATSTAECAAHSDEQNYRHEEGVEVGQGPGPEQPHKPTFI